MSGEMIRVSDPTFAGTSVPGVCASVREAMPTAKGVLFARKDAIDGRTMQPGSLNFVAPFVAAEHLLMSGYDHADMVAWLQPPTEMDRIYASCLLSEGIEIRAWDDP